MNRRTFGSVKTEIARLVANGVCDTDSRVLERVNEAQELLIDEGLFAEMSVRYKFCIYDSCLTLPRELEAILGYAMDCQPQRVRNKWYEFIDGGLGPQDCCGCSMPIDRGNVVTFRDICGSKYLRIYCDLPESSTAKILVKGFNENMNRVMTYVAGEWIDGEYISLASPYPNVSLNKFSSIDAIVKPVTNGYVRLYQYDADTGKQSVIGIFAPGEEYPTYRRYSVPEMGCSITCTSCSGTSTTVASEIEPHTVTILASKRFIQARTDNDDLFVTSLSALKNTVIALEARDNDNMQKYQNYLTEAKRTLSSQSAKHEGGNTPTLNIQGAGFFRNVGAFY